MSAAAVQQYLATGQVEAAARVLASMGCYGDASRLLLSIAGADPMRDAESKRLTFHAAVCLAHAGDRSGAASLLRSIGETARADALVPSAPPSARVASPIVEAAHAARREGRTLEAARLFERAGLPFEAGICFSDAGDLETAISHLVTVPPDASGYRSACVRVVEIVERTNVLSFEIDNFIAAFAGTDPTSPTEIDALFRLASIYASNDFVDESMRALQRVVRVDPSRTAAAKQLLAQMQRPDEHGFAAVAQEDLSFWARQRKAAEEVPASADGSVTSQTPHDSSMLAPGTRGSALAPGTILANRYVVDRELGRGGMGVVYAARDTDLDEIVALKAFAARVDDPSLVLRFKQEVILTRQLAHENVIRLYDMGLEGDLRFITMELLTGESLKDKIGALPLATALSYLLQIAKGLAAVHARGVVHRDLKPANVWVTADGVVKLMDFGLAKKVGTQGDDGITVSGFMAGTPGFMPPEQISSFGSVTSAADMYAFGITAYELLTGVRPFRHLNASQIFRLQYTTDPAPMRTLVPQLSRALDEVVLRLLDRDPAARPRAEDVIAALGQPS